MRPTPGGVPKYARIARDLRAAIISGKLPPGARLPSEPALVEDYSVSKTTAARALDLLAAEGLIVRQTGAGSFVAEAPPVATVEVGAGTQITARGSDPGDVPGAPAGTPVLVVQRPGAAAERYRADTTIVIVTDQARD